MFIMFKFIEVCADVHTFVHTSDDDWFDFSYYKRGRKELFKDNNAIYMAKTPVFETELYYVENELNDVRTFKMFWRHLFCIKFCHLSRKVKWFSFGNPYFF